MKIVSVDFRVALKAAKPMSALVRQKSGFPSTGRGTGQFVPRLPTSAVDAVRSLVDLRRLLPNGQAGSRGSAGLQVFAAGSQDGLPPVAQVVG